MLQFLNYLNRTKNESNIILKTYGSPVTQELNLFLISVLKLHWVTGIKMWLKVTLLDSLGKFLSCEKCLNINIFELFSKYSP